MQKHELFDESITLEGRGYRRTVGSLAYLGINFIKYNLSIFYKMVLSEQDKKILLDRLKAGREKKKAEREQAKKTTEAKKEVKPPSPEREHVLPQVTAPEIAPAVVTEEQKPSEPPRIDPSKTQKPAKQVEASSDSDSEIEEENKKKSSKTKNKRKNAPYMKIKIYQEPKNHEALNALIGAVQEEQQTPPVELSPPEKQRVSNVSKHQLAKPIVRQNTMRALAMDIFG